MKKLTWMAAVGIGLLANQAGAGQATELKTQKDVVSYTVGLQTGRHLKQDEIDIDSALFMKGLKDGMGGEKPLMSEKDIRKAMNELLGDVRRKAVEHHRIAAEENQKQGDAFLAANKTHKGVVTLPSGLQYSIVKEGDGKKPTDGNMVEVNYRGTLVNGTEFDASPDGKPATLQMSSLIPGWKEALKLMPVGSKWRIAVPPQLAYGERGAGQDIGPNQTLLFDVELVAVK